MHIHNKMMITVKLINFSFGELPFVFFLVWCGKWFWKLYIFRVFPVLYSIIKYSHHACLLLRSLIDSSCTTATLYPLNNLSLFHHPPPPPQPQPLQFPGTCFTLLIRVWFYLDSTYKWGHTIFVSFWCISLSIMSSSFIHIVTNDRISFCLMAE